MKIIISTRRFVTIGAVVLLALPSGLVAEEGAAMKESAERGRISHYAAPKVSNADEARSVFTRTLTAIATIVDDDTTSMAELEQVHQLSYTLESTLEFLLKDAPTRGLRSLSEAVEDLHLASEKHDGEATFAALQKIHSKKNATELK